MKRIGSALLRKLGGAAPAEIPAGIELQLATLYKSLPAGAGWLYEIKFDGYRILCRIDGGKCQLITRGQHDWTKRLSHLASDLLKLPMKSAWLDGELVALRADGVSDFSALQSAFRKGATSQLTYSVFDLLYLDGYDLRSCQLSERKRVLAAILEKPPRRVQYVDHVEGHGPEFFEQCRTMGLEGIVCKRAGRGHQPGRGTDWIKVKCKRREQFVIVGYLSPESRRTGLGALLLGSLGSDGEIHFEGRVGTGFSGKVEADLLAKLRCLNQTEPSIRNAPGFGRRGTHWVRPALIAEIEYLERTGAGELRHASYKGLRD